MRDIPRHRPAKEGNEEAIQLQPRQDNQWLNDDGHLDFDNTNMIYLKISVKPTLTFMVP